MGFENEKKCLQVLQANNGHLYKTVDTFLTNSLHTGTQPPSTIAKNNGKKRIELPPDCCRSERKRRTEVDSGLLSILPIFHL